MIVLLDLYRDLYRCLPMLCVLSTQRMTAIHDFTSLKTVTFGDESTVSPNRWASIISVASVFLIWGAFTGSQLDAIARSRPICRRH